ncbi:unnamed protein product [Parajaminaea phylloscopi]
MTSRTLSAASIWALMLLPWPMAAVSALAAALGFVSAIYSTDSFDASRRHLARVFVAYSVLLAVYALWMLISGIVWPMAHTRHRAFGNANSRRAFKHASVIINSIALLLIVALGPGSLVYAARGYYDDSQNGWIEGQAPIFAVLVVVTAGMIAANLLWDARGEQRRKTDLDC